MARSVNLSSGKVAAVEGVAELVDTIHQLQDAVQSEDVLKVLMAAAQTMKNEARERAPVDTGKLRDSIIATYGNQKGRKTDELNVIVTIKWDESDGPRYPFMVEFGHSGTPAHPYFRPALKAKRAEMTEIIADGFRKIIEDASK